MTYLKKCLQIENKADLPESPEDGTLILTPSQEVIDLCLRRRFPVAGYELPGQAHLSCRYLLLDPEDVDDAQFEQIYRRQKGIPLDISQTKRTLIREYAPADLDSLFTLYSYPGMCDYMESLYPYEEEKKYQEDYIRNIYHFYDFGIWLIFSRESGELIGRAGFEVNPYCSEAGQADLGFCIRSDLWKRGLAYEVCQELVHLAKNEYGLSSLIARCHEKNQASYRLLTKLGFSYYLPADSDQMITYRLDLI